MIDRLTSSILDIKSNNDLRRFSKTAIKQGVISRLLSALGWDIFNIAEVSPEFSGQGHKVDYCLNSGENKVLIAVEEPAMPLEKNEDNLIDFGINENAPIVLITNGIRWAFFYPCKELLEDFPPETNEETQACDFKFIGIDIFQNKAEEIGEVLSDYLSKSSIESGSAFRRARRIVKERLETKASIDRAWQRLLLVPDDRMVDLLRDIVEDEAGLKLSKQDVSVYLRNIRSKDNKLILKGQKPYNSMLYKSRRANSGPTKGESPSIQVLSVIKAHAAGIDTSSLAAETGLGIKSVHNAIYKLKGEGAIRTVEKGVYVSAGPPEVSDQQTLGNIHKQEDEIDNFNLLLRKKSKKIGIGD